MQLEQQENFTIHGPQLEILGEVETKLPAPAKKRGTASIVLVAQALVSVLGIGGPEMLSYTVPHDGIERALVRLPKISDTPEKYPRRFKKIQTAPL